MLQRDDAPQSTLVAMEPGDVEEAVLSLVQAIGLHAGMPRRTPLGNNDLPT